LLNNQRLDNWDSTVPSISDTFNSLMANWCTWQKQWIFLVTTQQIKTIFIITSCYISNMFRSLSIIFRPLSFVCLFVCVCVCVYVCVFWSRVLISWLWTLVMLYD
jgi:hypothetical protein